MKCSHKPITFGFTVQKVVYTSCEVNSFSGQMNLKVKMNCKCKLKCINSVTNDTAVTYKYFQIHELHHLDFEVELKSNIKWPQ